MKTNIRFLSYLAHFFLEWGMFQTKDVEKIETRIIRPITFFRKPCHLWDNVENIGDPERLPLTIWRMGTACCIIKATNTHSEYVIPIFFHCNNGCTNAPQCYVIRTLRVLLQPRWIVFIHSGSLVIEGPKPITTLQPFLHLVTVQNRYTSTTNAWRHTPQSPLWDPQTEGYCERTSSTRI